MTATLDLHPGGRPSSPRTMLVAQLRTELRLMLRNGEQLLLTIVIPSLILVVFAATKVADIPRPRVDFLMPGVMALAVMSTAFTGQAIATGFERRYGVLKRLATTPMPTAVMFVAKTLAVLIVEIVQIALLAVIAAALGWSPHGDVAPVIGLIALGTAAFWGLGLLLAGLLRAEATLAVANLLYLALLVVGGVAFPISDYGSGARDILLALPITAMTDGLREVLLHGQAVPLRDWVTLLGWTISAGSAAIAFFPTDR
jgi:ABC-2 type transport system permease protein